jgi:hypothetical protein
MATACILYETYMRSYMVGMYSMVNLIGFSLLKNLVGYSQTATFRMVHV